jgi:hypothetical protein
MNKLLSTTAIVSLAIAISACQLKPGYPKVTSEAPHDHKVSCGNASA